MKLRFAAPILTALVLPLGALAQAYPAKSIKFISPQPPGGTFDYVMRVAGASEFAGRQVFRVCRNVVQRANLRLATFSTPLPNTSNELC
jgi:hypothetical protein